MWTGEYEADERLFKVVVNDEEQYSIWPAAKSNAPGWRDAGRIGTRQQCLDHIQEVWTDLRPASLRRLLDASSAR